MSSILMSVLLTILMTALAPAIWGTTYIVTSEILPADSPFTAATIRCLPAGLLLILISRYIPKRHEWPKLIALSALNIGCFQALLFIAAYRLSGGLAAVIGAVQPLITLGLVWLMQGERPNWLSLLASILSITGMTLLLLSPKLDQHTAMQWDTIGIIAALVGAISMALGMYFSKHRQNTSSATALSIPLLAFTGWQLALGGMMLLPFSLLIDPAIPRLTHIHIAGYSYLTLVGTLLAYALWFKGIQQLPPVAVSALGLLSPLSAIALGWIFLGERIEGTALIGLITVLVSVLAVQWSQLLIKPSAKKSLANTDR
ncbi:EamA family transporter [Oceanospirillum multiglobuliferum]|uniref:EamA family transporter n=3 Tax=Oceanospirillum multiglobuliferum TaxID=64969 RepID=A0A1V4T7S2_9GAMM|nr:EamA family transporter [Oceanospirillum multiglobuliferum]